jgi:hypothetical protein
MQWKHPDTQLHEDIADLNREFLRLLVHPHGPTESSVFGLSQPCVAALRRLSDEQLETIALAPCLLAELQPDIGTRPDEPIVNDQSLPPESNLLWCSEVRVFAAEVLTYILHVSRLDPLAAALCMGLVGDADHQPAQLSFSRVRAFAERAELLMQARLCEHPRFWCDLIHAGAASNQELQLVSRLSMLSLAVMRPHTEETPVPRYRQG